MKNSVIIILSLLLQVCASNQEPPVTASASDPVVNIYINPCACSASEQKKVAMKELLSAGLDRYLVKNYIILDDGIEKELKEKPSRYLYNFSMNNEENEEPKKVASKPVTPGSDFDKKNENTGKTTINPGMTTVEEEIKTTEKENLRQKPESNHAMSSDYMDFNEVNTGDKEKIESLKNKSNTPNHQPEKEGKLVSGKINEAEIQNYLNSKHKAKIGQHHVYSNSPIQNRGLEIIKSFKSDRQKYKEEMQKRMQFRENQRIENYKRYSPVPEKSRPY
ncbi:MAG: hypothetical protein H7A25_16765 [Leptospiraceae bacterium]|nr:hypothetical protein [Leptospiraceae bacterium]MCP5501557.1 hypothetical protein [Leptospiraceae bacterium]